jgi:hypothetical protein
MTGLDQRRDLPDIRRVSNASIEAIHPNSAGFTCFT